MCQDLKDVMGDIARRQFILSHKLGVWYCLALGDRESELSQHASQLAELEARELLQAIQEAVHYRG